MQICIQAGRWRAREPSLKEVAKPEGGKRPQISWEGGVGGLLPFHLVSVTSLRALPAAMRLSSMLLLQPAPGRLAASHRGTSSCRRAVVVRAQQTGGPGTAPAAAPAPAVEQQAAPLPTAPEPPSQEPQQQFYDEYAAAESDASYAADFAAFEQQQAAAVQPAAPPPAGPSRGGLPLQLLQHPYARLAGIAVGIFLGGTFLITLVRMRFDPERKRKQRMGKNKVGRRCCKATGPLRLRTPLSRQAATAAPSVASRLLLLARWSSSRGALARRGTLLARGPPPPFAPLNDLPPPPPSSADGG